MNFEPFDLERWLSKTNVKYDLGGACVKSLAFKELDPDFDVDKKITYGHTNGAKELRKKISDLYPNTETDNVLITIGTAEANFLGLSTLLDKGDEMVIVSPTYMGSIGIAKALGAKVRQFYLDEENNFKIDLDKLNNFTNKKTKILFVTNPNNPTSTKLSKEEITGISEIAQDSNSYLFCDEALRGLELDHLQAPSPVSINEKGISTGSLSKLGLPGLRLGWIISDKKIIQKCWSLKDYTTLGIPTLTEYFGNIALEKLNFNKIVQRARDILNSNSKIFMEWVRKNNGTIDCMLPRAGATAFPKYSADIRSTTFCTSLLERQGILVAPGDVFKVPKHFRIKYGGSDESILMEILGQFDKFLTEISK